MRTGTTEERLAALEAEVTRLRAKVDGERPGVIGRTRPDFLDTMVGIHANSPHFDEVVVISKRSASGSEQKHIVWRNWMKPRDDLSSRYRPYYFASAGSGGRIDDPESSSGQLA